MGIYTAPSMTFIDSITRGFQDMDAKRAQKKQAVDDAVKNATTAGVDAYKFQQRKDTLDRRKKLEQEEAELMEQLRLLQGDRDFAGSRGNFDAIIGGLDYNLMPHTFRG